jgi:YbbR domain-containing protein
MSLRSLIQHNFWLKLFSLVLACLIWFAVDSDTQSARNVETEIFKSIEELRFANVPVSVLTSPDDRRAFAVKPGKVEVVVTGKREDLIALSADDLRVFVDLLGQRRPNLIERLHLSATKDAIALRAIPPIVTLGELKN